MLVKIGENIYQHRVRVYRIGPPHKTTETMKLVWADRSVLLGRRLLAPGGASFLFFSRFQEFFFLFMFSLPLRVHTAGAGTRSEHLPAAEKFLSSCFSSRATPPAAVATQKGGACKYIYIYILSRQAESWHTKGR